MALPTPNFAGFREAQERLRDHFGQDLIFTTPGEKTWPEGTEINSDTGLPYDPEVTPVESPQTQVHVSCNVVKDGVGSGGNDEATKTAAGWLKDGGIVIIVDISDWNLVRNATTVVYADDTYTIRDSRHDFIGSVDRYLIWATQ